jgi:hypothetical protein
MYFGKRCARLNLFDVMSYGVVYELFIEAGSLRVGHVDQLSKY